MKIKNLYIENEKRLKNLNINFENDGEILDIVVLVGVNGTGKTTILEIIYNYFKNIQQNINNKNKIDVVLSSEEKSLNDLILNGETKVIYVPAKVEFEKLWDNKLQLDLENINFHINLILLNIIVFLII